jgi:hypothetical protein
MIRRQPPLLQKLGAQGSRKSSKQRDVAEAAS